MVHLHLKKN